jgi:DNA-binding XRE family transcriptional regulator
MGKAKDIAKQMATEAKLKNMLLKLPEDHAGFSQRELADKSGIPRRTIRKIEAEAITKITDYIQQFIREEGSD